MKNFKVFYSLFVVTILSTTLSVKAQNTEQMLQQIIEATKKELPISMGPSGEIVDINLENDALVYEISINEDYAQIGNQKFDDLRANLKLAYSNPVPAIKYLEQMLADSNRGLKFIMKGDITGAEFTFELTKEDLHKILSNPQTTDSRATIESMVNIAKTNFPMQIIPGMSVLDVIINPTELVYVYELDDQIINVVNMRNNIEGSKAAIINGIKQEADPTLDVIAGYCIDAKMNIKYVYKIKGLDDQITFVISTEELKEVVPFQYRVK